MTVKEMIKMYDNRQSFAIEKHNSTICYKVGYYVVTVYYHTNGNKQVMASHLMLYNGSDMICKTYYSPMPIEIVVNLTDILFGGER